MGQLNLDTIKQFLIQALNEDLGVGGDITSNALIPDDKIIDFKLTAREDMILCGENIIQYFYSAKNIKYQLNHRDGAKVTANHIILEGRGNARDILMLERVVLNFIQHLSGISTLTNTYVEKIVGTKARICDTRKTIPGLRALQKYAVKCGGGVNHRLALDSSILIKDNHIAICGGVKEALRLAKLSTPFYNKIEIECDTLEQVAQAVQYGADIIMLDNMIIEDITRAVHIIENKAIIDASGGVNLSNVYEIAKAGVDYISIGQLTHSAKAVDIGLDI